MVSYAVPEPCGDRLQTLRALECGGLTGAGPADAESAGTADAGTESRRVPLCPSPARDREGRSGYNLCEAGWA
jgi:hypothetical protein